MKPELDSWETLCGDKLTLSGKETGILECKTPSSAILGVQLWPLRVYSSQQECPGLHLTIFDVSGFNCAWVKYTFVLRDCQKLRVQAVLHFYTKDLSSEQFSSYMLGQKTKSKVGLYRWDNYLHLWLLLKGEVVKTSSPFCCIRLLKSDKERPAIWILFISKFCLFIVSTDFEHFSSVVALKDRLCRTLAEIHIRRLYLMCQSFQSVKCK